MTKIEERLYIGCPYVRAREYLHQALEQAARSLLPKLLRLRAAVPATNMEVAKYVNVTYDHDSDPMHFDEPWRVCWKPEPGGVYPSFRGQLTVRAGENYECAILELTGEYEPPLGTAGRAFDAAIGKRVAADTARKLLSEIGAEMEVRYHREEAAKIDSVIS